MAGLYRKKFFKILDFSINIWCLRNAFIDEQMGFYNKEAKSGYFCVKIYLWDFIIFEYVGAEHTEGAGKLLFRAFGSIFLWGEIPAHSDHEVFIEASVKKRTIKLTYFNKNNCQNLSKECAPLHYSKGKIEGDDLDCYYIWVFEAMKGCHFLSLPASKIISIEMSNRSFDIDDLGSSEKETTITS